MKILLVARTSGWHRPGGMPYVTQDRAVALSRYTDAEVFLMTPTLPTSSVHEEIQFLSAGSQPDRWSREFADFCHIVADDIQPDMIHIDSFDVNNLWWSDFADRTFITLHGFSVGAMLTRLARFVNCQSEEPPNTTVAWQSSIRKEVRALKQARRVIAISSWEQLMLRQIYGLSNTTLIRNPIPDYFFDRPNTTRREQNLFGFVAGSQPEKKGINDFLTATENANVKTSIVSNKPRDQMPQWYDSLRALVLPTTFFQGFDLTVAEANARQTPVIHYDLGSYTTQDIPESVLGNIATPPFDVNGLSKELRSMKQQPPSSIKYEPDARMDNYAHEFMRLNPKG